MQGADLVAGGIQQIGQIEVAYGALAHTRRIFAAHSAIGDTGGMPGLHLPPGTLGIKAYGAAIALAGCVTVYGFGDGKDAGRGVMPVS
mgnify:FL=1